MDPDFWHERWNNNRIGFHQRGVNALMMAHFAALNLKPGSTVFVPLCGKSRDIGWLLAQGYRVIGSELSALAIDQLFEDLELEPDISDIGTLKLYRGPKLDVFVGDIFELTAERIGKIDGVYDRAALVALPADMRADYARHVHTITAGVRQFLLCFDYDQTVMEGPPFSVDKAEVERVHGHHYTLSVIEKADVVGGLKGVCPATETVWLLS